MKYNCAVLIILSVVNNCLACHTFENVNAEIYPKEGKPYNSTISGCIEPSKFSDEPDLQVVQVKINGQKIARLLKGTVQNLAKLKHVIFNNTSTEDVEPESFRHLPRLSGLVLIHSRLETVRNNVFQNLPALNKLHLHHNEIGVIEEYAFANIPSLKSITLGRNKIEEWNTKWFTNSTAIEEIDFQKNALVKIPARAFSGLGKLTKITLDYNKISEIESGAFEDIQQLELISLRYNCLRQISADIFSPGLTIDAMFIDYNILNFIGNEVLEKISLKEISLSGNPWKCPCLQRTQFWFYQKQGTSKLCGGCSANQTSKPVCVFSKVYSSTCLDVNDDEATNTYFNLSSNNETVLKCTPK